MLQLEQLLAALYENDAHLRIPGLFRDETRTPLGLSRMGDSVAFLELNGCVHDARILANVTVPSRSVVNFGFDRRQR